MKLIGQKPYHQEDISTWECMTEKEREEYHAFLADNEELFKESHNNDRSYKRKISNVGDSDMLKQFADGDDILDIRPSRGRKAAPRSPDFLDLIEEAAYHKEGKIYYRNKLIEDIMNSLSDKQREVLELTVIYGLPTKAIAASRGCIERNVRKLRERGLHNFCERYAETLRLRASITTTQRRFLEWYDAGKPKLTEPLPAKKSPNQTDYLAERYNEECGPCVTAVSRRSESA